MRKDRRLGRGLAALLGTPEPQQAAVPEKAKATKKKTTAAPADSNPAAAGSNDRTSLLMLDVYEIDDNPPHTF